MKVAFTTRDSATINAHFGSANRVDVYEVDTAGYTFLETLEFGGNLKEDGNEDKLEPKVKALDGCTLVYVSAIGGSAAARLIRKNITPVKAQTEADDIQDVLTRLVETLNGTVKAQIVSQIMAANLHDVAQSWIMGPDGSFTRPELRQDEFAFNCHRFFMENPSLSGRGSAGASDVPKLAHTEDQAIL